MAVRERGFSVLELTIAMGIMMVITGTMFSLLNPAQGSFAAQPEVSDLQQRLRVAQDMISRDLLVAGAGPYSSPDFFTAGSLDYDIPPVLPFKEGAGAGMDDPPGSFFPDRITLLYVPSTMVQGLAQGTLVQPFTPAGAGGNLIIKQQPSCASLMCGFASSSPTMSVLVVDPSDNGGNYDVFTINGQPANSTIPVSVPPDAVGVTYPAGSMVMQVIQRTYFVQKDVSAACVMPPPAQLPQCNNQLVYYDGSTNAPVPVVDHVVNLAFDYYGDRQPPQFKVPGDVPSGTTYGPAPVTGPNCVFSDQIGTPILPVLGDGSNPNTLIQLAAAQLTDGKWCGAKNPNRQWDADLLRIRKIGVRVRVEAALDSLRGPANLPDGRGGFIFTRAGTSIGPPRWVPDQEVYFQVSPRNMNLGR